IQVLLDSLASPPRFMPYFLPAPSPTRWPHSSGRLLRPRQPFFPLFCLSGSVVLRPHGAVSQGLFQGETFPLESSKGAGQLRAHYLVWPETKRLDLLWP
uniref:Uncharacterized protein n=1 Tax=Rhinolophus ferrumequinum TaxID=59479 RepID=A0A671EQ05_RHIFE